MTPRFLSPLIIKLVGRVGGRDLWHLQQPLRYHSAHWLHALQPLEIPAGFVTDLASVPRLTVVYGLVGGLASHAAVVHDYLYVVNPKLCSRQVADAVFYEAMGCHQPDLGVYRVPMAYRWLMWGAVRSSGYWGYHGRDLISEASLQAPGDWQAMAHEEGAVTL